MMTSDELTPEELVVFYSGHCPDCDGPLYEGPSGGMCTNYICGGLGESRYNHMGNFGVMRIGKTGTDGRMVRCPRIRFYPKPKPTFFQRLYSGIFS